MCHTQSPSTVSLVPRLPSQVCDVTHCTNLSYSLGYRDKSGKGRGFTPSGNRAVTERDTVSVQGRRRNEFERENGETER